MNIVQKNGTNISRTEESLAKVKQGNKIKDVKTINNCGPQASKFVMELKTTNCRNQ